MIEKIVIIGAGNLATQLALALFEKGIGVKQVYSRKIESASELAQKVNADFTTITGYFIRFKLFQKTKKLIFRISRFALSRAILLLS